MKNFVVKSVVLFVGVGLCGGVVLGMDRKEGKNPESYCDYDSNIQDAKGRVAKAQADLFSGKITDYKKELSCFYLLKGFTNNLYRFKKVKNFLLAGKPKYEEFEGSMSRSELLSYFLEYELNYISKGRKTLIDFYYDRFFPFTGKVEDEKRLTDECFNSFDFLWLCETVIFDGYIKNVEKELDAVDKYIEKCKEDKEFLETIRKKIEVYKKVKGIVEKQIEDEKTKK